MRRYIRTGAAFLGALSLTHGLGLAAMAGALDDATAPRMIASNGAVVVMPDLSGMDCTDMALTLRRIDLSDYRGPNRVPKGHPDWPIFVYEDKLTEAFYFSCTMSSNLLEDPGTAFSFGFEQN